MLRVGAELIIKDLGNAHGTELHTSYESCVHTLYTPEESVTRAGNSL